MSDQVSIAISKMNEMQREMIRRAPSDAWFSEQWEGVGGIFRSCRRLGLTFAREVGAQVLSPLGQSVQSRLLAQETA